MISNYRSRCVSIRFLERVDGHPIRLAKLSESAFQLLFVTKFMLKKICSNDNRKPIRHENWSGAITILYHENKVLDSKYCWQITHATLQPSANTSNLMSLLKLGEDFLLPWYQWYTFDTFVLRSKEDNIILIWPISISLSKSFFAILLHFRC